MMTYRSCSLVLLGYWLHQAAFSADGFQPAVCNSKSIRISPPTKEQHIHINENARCMCPLDMTTSTDGDAVYDDTLITKASKKLDWEKSEAKSQKPILNLSLRDVSPEESTADAVDDEDIAGWNSGQRWEITMKNLSELGVFANDEETSIQALLKNCPQLFRLDPTAIQGTAQWVIDEFGLAYLQNAVLRDGNSILLSFRKDDAAYGLQFMSLMMMTDAKMACAASSAFLLEAIRGGIQERTVSAALGAASNATSQAGKSVASETMESFRKLRDANRHKK